MDRRVLVEMSDSSLRKIIERLDEHKNCLIVQFTANWCKPCKSIKDLCNCEYTKLPKQAIVSIIDIDDNMDLYLFMKKKRMLTGIPCIMVWLKPNSSSDWFVPDRTVSGADETAIRELFSEVGKTLDPNYGREDDAKICVMSKDE